VLVNKSASKIVALRSKINTTDLVIAIAVITELHNEATCSCGR